MKPIVAVTMGDPGGIGPEIIARTLQDLKKYQSVFILLIGARAPFEFLEDEFHLGLPLNPVPTLHRDFFRDDSVNFLDITEEANRRVPALETVFEIGKVSRLNAALAL